MNYLVFGGTGSLGRKLINRLNGRNITVYSRDEAKHWTIKNEMGSRQPNFIVGDIRDPQRVFDAINRVRPDRIIVAAALKHVDTCESSPYESIQTNVLGTKNVIDAVNHLYATTDWGNAGNVKTVTFVSTDKACAPVNSYGMCKALSERLITSQKPKDEGLIFNAVRYGNVLESRGSIIPLFKYQCESADQITVTDPNMTRFVMTLDDSVNLIFAMLANGQNGQIGIPQLPAMKIGDLSEIFAETFGKTIRHIGLRPGEKMHEDLINESESIRTTVEDANRFYGDDKMLCGRMPGDNIFLINDALSKPITHLQWSYSSNQTFMSKDQLRAHLTKLGIINAPLSSFIGQQIEEIRND